MSSQKGKKLAGPTAKRIRGRYGLTGEKSADFGPYARAGLNSPWPCRPAETGPFQWKPKKRKVDADAAVRRTARAQTARRRGWIDGPDRTGLIWPRPIVTGIFPSTCPLWLVLARPVPSPLIHGMHAVCSDLSIQSGSSTTFPLVSFLLPGERNGKRSEKRGDRSTRRDHDPRVKCRRFGPPTTNNHYRSHV